ncbi:unnamed protein product [Acanthoscelides obtectus]|uniref:Uncharacterized protein n=1 Tax=Acanthoscelides obtectus TaxID=200917 RepID=A0A9P0LCY8_ACAOB|nr:unnamed protein product [Acanthoscelides obtectus]
MMWKQLAEF